MARCIGRSGTNSTHSYKYVLLKSAYKVSDTLIIGFQGVEASRVEGMHNGSVGKKGFVCTYKYTHLC